MILNLPTLNLYDPSLPWVDKSLEDGLVAMDIFWYIDDGQPASNTTKTAYEDWKDTRKIEYTLCYLGLQDVSRKRTELSNTPEKWMDALIETSGDRTSVLVSQKKWMKRKVILVRIREEVEKRGCFNHKQL